jgi:hypothetical protein
LDGLESIVECLFEGANDDNRVDVALKEGKGISKDLSG